MDRPDITERKWRCQRHHVGGANRIDQRLNRLRRKLIPPKHFDRSLFRALLFLIFGKHRRSVHQLIRAEDLQLHRIGAAFLCDSHQLQRAIQRAIVIHADFSDHEGLGRFTDLPAIDADGFHDANLTGGCCSSRQHGLSPVQISLMVDLHGFAHLCLNSTAILAKKRMRIVRKFFGSQY